MSVVHSRSRGPKVLPKVLRYKVSPGAQTPTVLFPVRGVGFRVLGLGFWVLGLGFRVQSLSPKPKALNPETLKI